VVGDGAPLVVAAVVAAAVVGAAVAVTALVVGALVADGPDAGAAGPALGSSLLHAAAVRSTAAPTAANRAFIPRSG
jgi:hypothetical protein